MPVPQGLWAITCYFNPMRYRRRLSNFRLFRKHLNIPLVAVELAYGEEFELHEQDAEVLIQLRGGALLWQKERLLNVALLAVPSSCRRFAWLDCDILFGNADWAHTANSLLDRFSLIQLFKQVHYLSPHWTPGENPATHVELTRPSVAFSLASGVPAVECIGRFLNDPAAPEREWFRLGGPARAFQAARVFRCLHSWWRGPRNELRSCPLFR